MAHLAKWKSCDVGCMDISTKLFGGFCVFARHFLKDCFLFLIMLTEKKPILCHGEHVLRGNGSTAMEIFWKLSRSITPWRHSFSQNSMCLKNSHGEKWITWETRGSRLFALSMLSDMLKPLTAQYYRCSEMLSLSEYKFFVFVVSCNNESIKHLHDPSDKSTTEPQHWTIKKILLILGVRLKHRGLTD